MPHTPATPETSNASEAKLAGIINSAMDAIISINDGHEIILFNAAAERIFKCPVEEAIGTLIHRFVPERYRDIHARHIRDFAETGVTTRSMGALRPLVAVRTDGTEFPIEATISQVEVGGQRLFSVILRDITERKLAEAERERQAAQLQEQATQLEEANRELARVAAEAEAANKAKADFLAMMSHELRTPINAITGYAQLIEMGLRGPITPDIRADLERIQRSGRHLMTVINNILNFARIEAGSLEYTFSDVPLMEVLAEVSGLLEPQMVAKTITYIPPQCDASVTVYADADKLRQILLNLLTNAVKFTEPGERVWIDCPVRDDHVLLRVHDTGCGIAPDKLELVFEPFVQLERSLTKIVQGTGLGLSISRDLARGMGGDLTAESELGVGSTFSLKLLRSKP